MATPNWLDDKAASTFLASLLNLFLRFVAQRPFEQWYPALSGERTQCSGCSSWGVSKWKESGKGIPVSSAVTVTEINTAQERINDPVTPLMLKVI